MTWLNWPLKLHFGLRTIPHLILTHNTQDFVQWMLISFVSLYVFKCHVYTQLLVNQTQQYLFYMFLKVFLYFHVLSFCSNCIFHVFHQRLLQRNFSKKLATKLFLRKWVKTKYENTKFRWKLSQLSRYFALVNSSHRKFCVSEAFFTCNFARS